MYNILGMGVGGRAMSAILFGYLQTSTIQMLKAILGFVMLLLVFGSRNATTASASAYGRGTFERAAYLYIISL